MPWPRRAARRGSQGDQTAVIRVGRRAGNVQIVIRQSAGEAVRYVITETAAAAGEVFKGNPSSWLFAEREIVPFTAREQERAELSEWLAATDQAAVRLLTGAGGQGKTRLARQVARDAQQQGWTVLTAQHVRSGGRPRHSESTVATGSVSPGLVLVVDYAERWPLDDLLKLLSELIDEWRDVGRLRVLLLARTGRWWPGAEDALIKQGFSASEADLAPVAQLEETRREAFDVAVRAFCSHSVLGVDAERVPRPISLASEAFGLFLTIHMAALVAVLSIRDGRSSADTMLLSGNPASVTEDLIKRERSHWELLNRDDAANRVHSSPESLARAMFVATVVGGSDYEDGRALLAACLPGTDATQLLDDHRRANVVPGSMTGLQPFMPNRLGEDFVAALLPDLLPTGSGVRSNAFSFADPASPGILRALLALGGDDADPDLAGHARPAFRLLVDVAVRWPRVARDYLVPALVADPRLALQGGGDTLATLAGVLGPSDVTERVLGVVQAEKSTDASVDLAIGAGAVAEQLVRRARNRGDRRLLSSALLLAAVWTAEAGRTGDAIAHAQEALDVLASQSGAPDGGTPDVELIVASLTTLARRLLDVRRPQEALQVMQNAVALVRPLAGESGDLATILDNYSGIMSEAGYRLEAVQPAREALEIRLALVGGRLDEVPEDLADELADSLTNVALHVWRTSRSAEAVEMMASAVRVRRLLYAAGPAAFGPRLAITLQNYGLMLSEHDPDRAIEIGDEAVTLFRSVVVEDNPRYWPDLAMALTNLALRHAEQGRPEAGLTTAEEATRICRDLLDRGVPGMERDLAQALVNEGHIAADAGDIERAKRATRGAIELYDMLGRWSPLAFLPELGTALSNLALYESQSGEHGQAEADIDRALKIRRRLLPVGAVAFRDLVTSLKNDAAIAVAADRSAGLRRADEAHREIVDLTYLRIESVPDREIAHIRALSLQRRAEIKAALVGELLEAEQPLRDSAAAAVSDALREALSCAREALALRTDLLDGTTAATQARDEVADVVDSLRQVMRALSPPRGFSSGPG